MIGGNYYTLFGKKLTKTQYVVILMTAFFLYNMTAAVFINWLNPIPGWILFGIEVLAVLTGAGIGIYNVIKEQIKRKKNGKN